MVNYKLRLFTIFIWGLVGLFFTFITRPVTVFASEDYQVSSFHSQITLNQDTSLTVKETIKVDFLVEKHGIIRVIPIIYSAGGQTIKASLTDTSVTDDQDNPIPAEQSRLAQSIQLKIGDPNRTLTRPQTYIINYRITDVVRRFDNHEEVYC